MFKKIAGLFLAAAVMCSSAAITASAAEAEDDAAVAAADQSGEVSADGSSEVSADASSEVEAGNVVKFDVKKSGWNNVKSVFCHIWKADGSGDWPAWQSKKEKCKYDASTGIATYDLSKTGNTISKSDGRVYCVIFSANTGMQSYNAIMSGKCIGDTLYCTGNQLENPEDSEKKANEAKWENNSDCGPEKKITSTGNIIGSAFPEGESDATLLATYLVAYYNDEAKTSFTQKLLDELKVSPTQVMGAVTDRLNATKTLIRIRLLLQLRRFSQVAQILQQVKRLTRLSSTTLRRQVLRQQPAAQATVQVLLQATVAQAHQVQVLQAQVQLSQVLKQLSFS